jgi:lipid-binding SYLF domain-containing protein
MFGKLKEKASKAASDIQASANAAGEKLQQGAKDASDKISESAKNSNINSPLPASLSDECIKAAKILGSFTQKSENETGFDNIIPVKVIQDAKGLAIFTVIKAGFIWSGRAGSGLVVAKLDDGSWSAPSAIATGGVGFGAQIGADITDFVIILNTPEAVTAFSKGGNLTFGGNLQVSAGPIGAGGEAGISAVSTAPIFSYSKSKGLFAGVSLEGSALIEMKDSNEKFYGRAVQAEELLSGKVSSPAEAQILYDALQASEKRES